MAPATRSNHGRQRPGRGGPDLGLCVRVYMPEARSQSAVARWAGVEIPLVVEAIEVAAAAIRRQLQLASATRTEIETVSKRIHRLIDRLHRGAPLRWPRAGGCIDPAGQPSPP